MSAPAADAAQLDLTFARSAGGPTLLARRRVRYPYALMAPFRLDREPPHMATVLLQSASGGIFADDRLGQRIVAEAGAAVRVATSSATVVHAMPDRREATQSVALAAGPRAVLQYLPQPLVLFPGSRLTQRLAIEAHEEATVLVCDGFLLHDPGAAGRAFEWLDATIEMRRPDGRLLALDRTRLRGCDMLADLPGVARGCRAVGSVVLLAPLGAARAQELGTLAAAAASAAGCYAGATVLRDDCGLLLRLAAADGGDLVKALRLAWRSIHAELHGAPAGFASG